ncbi:nickel ABC transporter substrate-binding protein [Helicobacter sp. MIT 14-3879]|uniref:nickel ABC transporter substrate-binding protein n=1 Tax=Helicobacter sp. MIT 14-3879 TaxID=2040649 RepID=UPI000E1EB9F2|nr:nickel ABC transporter substrate-binding protein [Helicobacter sp. MIT 14-3879]RDU61699.1 nickel ABC transporter, nickel/metallophore periplasmic binding protein [Helicobacter sp. MIT 14-3879]
MVRLFLIFLLSINLYAENILRVAVSRNVGVMNPQGYGSNEMFAQNMIYEGLVKVNNEGKIVPSLATSWEIKQKGKVYVFNLRKNVLFSNGEEFNSNAVKKNFDSILKNAKRHSWSALIALINDIEVVDSHTIKIHLKSPYSPTLNELALVRPYRFIAPSMIPSDLDLVKHNPKEPIGTGAYMLVDTKLGVSDTFRKNPNYWDRDSYNGIYFDLIITKVIVEPNAKLIALKTKQIDLIYGFDEIPIEIFKNISETNEFNTYTSSPIFTTTLVMNPKNDFLSSKLIRQAIIMGINKDELIKSVYYNYQQKADYLFAKNMPYTFNVKYANLAFSQNKARQNIESLGYVFKNGYFYRDSKRLELELIYVGNNPAQKFMAEILQANLKDIGIFLKLTPTEATIYRKKQTNAVFDLCFNDTWGIPYEPLTMLNSMTHTGHVDFAVQQFLKEKPKIDSDIKKAITMQDKDLLKFIPNILSEIYNLDIYIPLTYQTNKAIANKNLKGIVMPVVMYEIPFWEFYK